MNKKPLKTTTNELTPLITELRGLIQSARHAVATTVNTLQVLTNFEIGRRIVEHEQKGAERAEYGKELLKKLSARLTEEFGEGFSDKKRDASHFFSSFFKNGVTERAASSYTTLLLSLNSKRYIVDAEFKYRCVWI